MPELQTQSGTGIATPQPTKTVKWITAEEAEDAAKMMDRQFVKKGNAAEAKKFYYKITGLHRYEPQGVIGNSIQFLLAAHVVKYHRNKKRKVSIRLDGASDAREVEVSAKVEGHVADPETGTLICIDSEADQMMDMREFKERFELDSN